MKRIRMRGVSLSPLLMNAPSPTLLEELRTKTTAIKPRLSREEECRGKLYTDDKGAVGIPAENFYACLINAGQHVKIGKKQVSTLKGTMLPAFLAVEETFLPLTNGKPGEPAEWEPNVKRGQHDQNGKKIMVAITRPRFNEWSFEATLLLDEKVANPSVVREIMEMAGSRVGLCDFRPACKGPYGRFRVESFEEIPA